MNAMVAPALTVSDETLEELLKNWARWCRGSIIPCGEAIGSLEGGYEASGEEAQEARRQPKDTPPRDYDGLLVERMVIRMPKLERDVLRVEYVFMPRRKVETLDQLMERRRRRLKMPRWQYEEAVRRARNMVANLLRRHGRT